MASSSDTPTTFARLRYLHVIGGQQIFPFLGSLTLPALQSLLVATIRTGHTETLSKSRSLNFRAFIARSNPPLQNLTIERLRLEEDLLVEVLELVPTLQSLAVRDELTDKLILALSGQPGDSFICPNLTTIRLTQNVTASDGIISTMVEQRWGENAAANQITSLKVVQVDCGLGDHAEDVRSINRLRLEGLKAAIFAYR